MIGKSWNVNTSAFHLQRQVRKMLIIVKYISTYQENSVISLLNNYLYINFEIIKKAAFFKCASGNGIRLAILGPDVLFSSFKLTTSNGKHLKGISFLIVKTENIQ